MSDFLIVVFISLALNLIIFTLAYYFKTDKFTDLTYSLTFIAITIFELFKNKINKFSIILGSMTFIWAFRLGFYLLIRIIKLKKDKRFDTFRNNFFKLMQFWIFQAISVLIIMLSSIISFKYNRNEISFISYLGILIWLKGFLIESIADYQKFKFIVDAENKNKWISTGIWKYSRHPNYFGEILIWIGIYVFCIENLPLNLILFGSISPIFITFLLLFISGIPILEKSADKKWGREAKYLEYKRKTSVLIPNLFNIIKSKYFNK